MNSNRVFPDFHHPVWGSPPFGTTHIYHSLSHVWFNWKICLYVPIPLNSQINDLGFVWLVIFYFCHGKSAFFTTLWENIFETCSKHRTSKSKISLPKTNGQSPWKIRISKRKVSPSSSPIIFRRAVRLQGCIVTISVLPTKYIFSRNFLSEEGGYYEEAVFRCNITYKRGQWRWIV